MRSDISVPEFALNAGGARLRVEHDRDDERLWDLRLPNNLGLTERYSLAAPGFDEARVVAEELAAILTEAESAYQVLRDRTSEKIAHVFARAHERSQEGDA